MRPSNFATSAFLGPQQNVINLQVTAIIDGQSQFLHINNCILDTALKRGATSKDLDSF